MLPDDAAEILQQVLDPFLFLFERVLQVVALQEDQQSLQVDNHLGLRANRVAQPLLTRQQCCDAFEAVRDIVIATLPVGSLEQFGSLGIVLLEELGQLQQLLLELLVARRDVLLLAVESGLGGTPSSRRLPGFGFQANVLLGSGALLRVLGRNKHGAAKQQRDKQQSSASMHAWISSRRLGPEPVRIR